MDVYPVVFEPLLKSKVWGGRHLERLLGKTLPPDAPIGESWELVDLEGEVSVVANGPLRGTALPDLVREWGPALMGDVELIDGRFPLLLKFLDARETLSVQVHPDEETAQRLGGAVRPKNEAWYVVHANDDACIFRGARDGTTAEAFRAALESRGVGDLLCRIPVRAGHCYYLPSGVIHALGGGVVVAEVQTPSDVTYRLFDWDRIDPSVGGPRELHVEQGLGCARFDAGPYPEERQQHVASVWTTVTTLVRSPWFSVDRVRMVEGADQPVPLDRSFVVWMILEGRCRVRYGGGSSAVEFNVGDTVLLPAGLKEARVETLAPSMWLEVSVPLASTLAGLDRLDPAELASNKGGPFVPLRMPKKQ
ncbi:MAG: class I mannose-6-phosphate isomerase [Phycisphaerae bacterium]|nr:class I mannose-6-phosphate isomerase [Phycisphaerae bacterium]